MTDVNHSTTISTMPHEPTTQVAFRLADRLLSRVDRHVRRLGKASPGLRFTRADAARDLLTRALDSVESEGKSK